MTPEEGLRRSLAEFQATLDSMRLAGVSQVAEVQSASCRAPVEPTGMVAPGAGVLTGHACREGSGFSGNP
ncbi:hypothetical protein [Actinoallomurus rhizosphaericola]|uniref:hypothetical protein n=1 Tax=Actinoallomurus rhizosphaericola TaxID=2952536 RepID=UPI002093D164|nr:hypothetical protein [Actinoallomurus rhizosphaericola]MCO5998199.1 hypothetical protein [Actinoallomurus rhizosphaericola]